MIIKALKPYSIYSLLSNKNKFINWAGHLIGNLLLLINLVFSFLTLYRLIERVVSNFLWPLHATP